MDPPSILQFVKHFKAKSKTKDRDLLDAIDQAVEECDEEDKEKVVIILLSSRINPNVSLSFLLSFSPLSSPLSRSDI